MNNSPKIAFWGTPELTIVYLDALEKAGLIPAVIITNPDRPKGRGLELTPPPPKVWALTRNIPVLQPEKLDGAFNIKLSTFNLDVSLVVAYGKIMPKNIIDFPLQGTLNVHYSLLPRWRGASPTEAVILAGDTETGASIQMMAEKLDSGDIIAESRTDIGATENTTELRGRLTGIGAELLIETLPRYLSGETKPRTQYGEPTHCGKIKKEDGLIDPKGNVMQNYRKYRAFIEWPGIYFFTERNGKNIRVKITGAHIENDAFIIDRVIPEGKKEMLYSVFLQS